MRSRLKLVLLALAVAACATQRSQQANVARVRIALASEDVHRRDWAAALQTLDPLPEGRQERAAALALRGVIFRETGRLEDAQADLEQAVRLRSDLAEAHAALGVVYELRRDHARAVK